MRQAEFDIITADGTYCNEKIKVDSSANLTDIVTAASQLLGICHWQKVRVGVGSQLSEWITTPTATKEKKNINNGNRQHLQYGLPRRDETNPRREC